MDILQPILTEAEKAIEGPLQYIKEALSKILVNRIDPDMLKNLQVKHHGIPCPLEQVAHISIHNASTLAIKPWEKDLIPTIEKTLMDHNTYNLSIRSDESAVYCGVISHDTKKREKRLLRRSIN